MIEILGIQYKRRSGRIQQSERFKKLIANRSLYLQKPKHVLELKEELISEIVSEYELVLQKKSKLPRASRDFIESEFNKYFEKA